MKNTHPESDKTIYEVNSISSNIVDVVNNEIYPAKIEVQNGKIISIQRVDEKFDTFLIPGFIDSHIHIESTMLTPCEFARIAVVNGMIAVVADAHEIGNVLGLKGVEFMISNGKKVPFKFYFGAPACVPATKFETSGVIIDSVGVEELLKLEDVKCLGEVMDFVGVVNDDAEIVKKIETAKRYDKVIDGHAPSLSGEDLKKYVGAGISTDHECSTKQEAIEKIKLGMKILIREGSAAKDFDALHSLIEEYPDFCMFSSDDRHPNELVKGHINLLVKKSIKLGYDKMKVLKCACVNPVKHYRLDVGLLQEGDSADFLQIDNFEDLNILKTVINGKVVNEDGWSLIEQVKPELVNNFGTKAKAKDDFLVPDTGKKINVIKAEDGSLLTSRLYLQSKTEKGFLVSDTERDILKITVVNRYQDCPPSVAFVKGFGLKKGAIASSVSHDSHNLIAVGTSDEEITRAINKLIDNKGGLCVVNGDKEVILPLPIAGLMSDKGAFYVAGLYEELEAEVKLLGSNLSDAFMTLSFMALLVIPELKLSDKGLFDSKNYRLIELDEPAI